MSNKMLIGVVVLMLIVVVVIIGFVSNSFKDDGTRYQEKTPGMITKDEEQQTQKSYSNLIDEANKIESKYKSLNYNEEYILLSRENRATIDKVIDEVLGLIESHNAEEIYKNHLANSYLQSRFPDEEELEKYMNSTFSQDAKFSIKAYEISGNTLLLPIIETKLGTDIELNTLKVVDFLTPSYALYFDNVQEVLTLMNKFRKNEFEININYSINYADYSSIILRITNRTNSVLDLDFDKTYVEEAYGKVYKKHDLLGEPRISIAPGKTVLYEAKFDRFKVYPDALYFNIKYDNKTIENEREYLNFNMVNED